MGHLGEFPFLGYFHKFQQVFAWASLSQPFGDALWTCMGRTDGKNLMGYPTLRIKNAWYSTSKMLPFHYYIYTWDPVLQGILKSLKYRNSLDHRGISAQSPKTTWNILEPRPVWTLKDFEKPLIHPLTQGVMIFDDILDLQSSKKMYSEFPSLRNRCGCVSSLQASCQMFIILVKTYDNWFLLPDTIIFLDHLNNYQNQSLRADCIYHKSSFYNGYRWHKTRKQMHWVSTMYKHSRKHSDQRYICLPNPDAFLSPARWICVLRRLPAGPLWCNIRP